MRLGLKRIEYICGGLMVGNNLRFALSVNNAVRDVQERDRGMKICINLLLY